MAPAQNEAMFHEEYMPAICFIDRFSVKYGANLKEIFLKLKCISLHNLHYLESHKRTVVEAYMTLISTDTIWELSTWSNEVRKFIYTTTTTKNRQ